MKATRENKPIEYYLDTIYPVTVYTAPEGGYVAEIEDLPGCITEGETLEEVFQRIEDTRRAWIEIQYEEGSDIPIPRTDEEYSGKFLMRLPKGLHRKLAEQAKREGVSLNQYVETLLVSKSTMKDLEYDLCETIAALVSPSFGAWTPPTSIYTFTRERPPIYRSIKAQEAILP